MSDSLKKAPSSLRGRGGSGCLTAADQGAAPRCEAIDRIPDRMGRECGFQSMLKQPLMSALHLYDWYVCVRKGVVKALWPIMPRGAVT
jgi:hypothetical protein